MPKYPRKKHCQTSATHSSAPTGTAREITVRTYDKGVHQRASEIQRIVRCVRAQIGHSALFERIINESINETLLRGASQAFDTLIEQLNETIIRYSLISLSFIARDDDKVDAGKYFALVAAENIDSTMLDFCARIEHQITILLQITEMIDCANKHEKFHTAYDECARVETYETPAMKRIIARAAKRTRQNVAPNAITTGTPIHEHELWSPQVFDEFRAILRESVSCLEHVGQIMYPVYPDTVDILACECGARMRASREMYRAVCDNCGRIAELTFSDGAACVASAPILEYSRDRRGVSNYLRHLKKWLDRLQGIEKFELIPADVARLRASIVSEYANTTQIYWRKLQYEEVARHLNLCGLSHLSEHIPRLLCELGVAAPPILSYDDEQVITRDFMHIMDIYMSIYRDPGNKPYYPFFIVKIIKQRFRNSEISRLLHFIPRQGWDTTYKNDRIYENICRAAPPDYDLVYIPETE